MKRLLLALLLFLFAAAGCKKEKSPETPVTTTPITSPLVTVSSISPSSGTAGTVVTITGTNFGTSTTAVEVFFSGKAGTIQSVTPNEIKVVMPETTTGVITLQLSNQVITGPQFTYLPPVLNVPYVSGDVVLTSQAAVDLFVAVNKGSQLQITGNLNIIGEDITSVAGLSNITSVTGEITVWARTLTEASFLNTITTAGSIKILFSGFTSLSFNGLNSFSGEIYFQGLHNLNHVSFNGLTTTSGVLIDTCPLLTDLSFLNNLYSSGGFALSNVGATALTMDQLTTTGGMFVANCKSLTTISMRALTGLTADGSFTFSACSSLSNLNFPALSAIPNKLTISGTNISDMVGFNSLAKLGSLTVINNSILVNFQGLEHLTTFTEPAIGIGSSASLMTRLNGIYAINNPKLTSLTGLQNVTTLPVAYIANNASLSNFCPLKVPIITLSTLPAYSYKYYNTINNRYYDASVPALTLTNNSSYATTADALAAVKLCN